MAVNYTITFINNSTMAGNICIFQQKPGNTDPSLRSLAWLTMYSNPTTAVTFNWTPTYGFFFTETILSNGVTINASQIVPADLNTSNSIHFGKTNDAYQFENQAPRSHAGTLYIINDPTVTPLEMNVGIGMSGAGTFVKPAQPNLLFSFDPAVEYWITFGNFSPGQVLDIPDLPTSARVDFPQNTFRMKVTLDRENLWTVMPGE